MIFRCFLAVFFVLVFSGSSLAQFPPLPLVDGWPAERNIIDVKISDSVMAYLGFELKFQNPRDPQEFVMVVLRSIPAIVRKPEINDDRSLIQFIVGNYSKKDEEDLLKTIFEERSDPILYTKWRVKKDPRTGEMVQDGEAMVWFQDFDGEWTVTSGKRIAVEFMTRLVGEGNNKNISVGRRYSLDGEALQILTVSQTDLDQVIGEGRQK